MRKRRHPWRGIFGGIFLGIALAVGSFIYGFHALGPITPWVMFVLGVVIGVLLVFVPRPWGRRRPSTTAPTG